MIGVQIFSSSFFWYSNSSCKKEVRKCSEGRNYYLLGSLVGIEPLDGLAALVGDGLDLVLGDLVLDLVVLDGLLHLESIGLELVL